MDRNKMYNEAIKIYKNMVSDTGFGEGFFECDIDENNKSLFSNFDGDEETYYPVNNMAKIKPIDLIRKNNFLNIVDTDLLNNVLNFLDFRLFQYVREIVFLISDDDDLYLEEEYGIWVNPEFLGQSNRLSKVAIINVRKILSAALNIESINTDNKSFNLTVCCEIIKTLIHELVHINSFEDMLSKEHKVIYITDKDDEDDEETKVEALTNDMFFNMEFSIDWRILSQDFTSKYQENHENICDEFLV